MPFERLIFRVHALRRMFERNISVEDVRHILKTGSVIETYPNDKPYPSCLMLGFIKTRPIHVVAANNEQEKEMIVITVYEPTSDQWENNFKRRRK